MSLCLVVNVCWFLLGGNGEGWLKKRMEIKHKTTVGLSSFPFILIHLKTHTIHFTLTSKLTHRRKKNMAISNQHHDSQYSRNASNIGVSFLLSRPVGVSAIHFFFPSTVSHLDRQHKTHQSSQRKSRLFVFYLSPGCCS